MSTPEAVVAAALEQHHQSDEWGYPVEECRCGTWFDGTWAEHVAAVVVEQLALVEEWSDDVAGPEWARYSRSVTRWVTHHGPRYIGVGSTQP